MGAFTAFVVMDDRTPELTGEERGAESDTLGVPADNTHGQREPAPGEETSIR